MMPNGKETVAEINFGEKGEDNATEVEEKGTSQEGTEEAEKQEEEQGSDAGNGNEESNSNEGGSEEGTEEGEESLEDYKARLKKAEEERDNYKEAVLISKKKDREISEEKELSDKEKEELGEDGIKAIQDRRINEKDAISSFVDDHKDYVDDKAWNELMSHYVAPENATSENIEKALSAAHIIRQYDNGELVSAKEAQKKVTEAQTKAQVRNISSSNGQQGKGSRTQSKSNKGAAEMSGRFKHSNAKAVNNMDDSNEQIISITG